MWRLRHVVKVRWCWERHCTVHCSFAKQHFWLVHRKQGLPRRPETVFTLDGAKRAIITVKLLHFTTIEPRPFPKRGSRHVTTSKTGSHMRRWIALEPGATRGILLSYQCGLPLIELWSGYRFVEQKWRQVTDTYILLISGIRLIVKRRKYVTWRH